MTALLQIEDLTVELSSGLKTARVLNGISFNIKPGEIVGLVGESGCGKSVTALTILQLLPGGRTAIKGGSVRFRGQELTAKTVREMRQIRGKDISMIFQEPMTSLNPVFTVGQQIADVISAHTAMRPAQALQYAVLMMRRVQIPDPDRIFGCYPHELSGGMRQRVMIAAALSCQPGLLIADEPTTALDVTIQAQILTLIRETAQTSGTAVLFITHDLGVVAQLCSRMAVMYAGEIVEIGNTGAVLNRPLHPYTAALLKTVPDISREGQKLLPIPGVVPNVSNRPSGCSFHPRCSVKYAICIEQRPPLNDLGDGHKTACWRELPEVGML